MPKHVKISFFFWMVVLQLPLLAQQSSLSGGGSGFGSGGVMEFSVGQVAFNSITQSGFQLNEGVQQPFELYTVTQMTDVAVKIEAILYPNPAAEYVLMTIKDAEYNNLNLRYRLQDMNGKIVTASSLVGMETLIPLSGMQNGSYSLVIFQNERQIQQFKIIKNQ